MDSAQTLGFVMTRHFATAAARKWFQMGVIILPIFSALPLYAMDNANINKNNASEIRIVPGTERLFNIPAEFISTIEQADKDISSNDSDRRKSAAILLGKYNYARAQQLLLVALDDASVEVRRAAAISLKEHPFFANKEIMEKFLIHLSDSDIEVRRTVSGSIATIGSQLNHHSNFTASSPYQLPAYLQQIIFDSFQDSDPIVRLNLTHSFHTLNIRLPSAALEKLLTSKEDEIIIAGLQKLRYSEINDDIVRALGIIASNKNSALQYAILESLITSSDSRIVSLLLGMTNTNDPEFHLAHYLISLNTGREISDEEHEKTAKQLSGIHRSSRIVLLLTGYLNLVRTEIVNMALIVHPLDEFRVKGWNNLLRDGTPESLIDIIRTGLDDSSQIVRQTLINHLLARPEDYFTRIIDSMLQSPVMQIRVGAAEMMIRMPADASGKKVFQLLVDESPDVRSAAIRVFVKHRITGWQQILSRSLKDRDINVQKQSAGQLFLLGKEGIDILKIHVQHNPDDFISTHIKSEFARRRISFAADTPTRHD